MAVRGPHHCDVDSNVVESDDPVRPTSLDWRLALQLQTTFDKESDSSCKVVDNNADVLHSLKRHVPDLQTTKSNQIDSALLTPPNIRAS